MKWGGKVGNHNLMLSKGHSRQRCALWHDQGPLPERCRYPHQPSDDGYNAAELGDVHLLLRHAGGSLPDDFYAPALPGRSGVGRSRHPVGHHCYAHRHCHVLAGALCAALLPWLRRERGPDCFHVHCQRLLYAARTSAAPKLVVLFDRGLDDYRRCFELWLCSDHGGIVGEVAVYLSFGWLADRAFWMRLFCGSQFRGVGLVSYPDRTHRCCGEVAERSDGRAVSEVEGFADSRGSVGCQDLARCAYDGCCLYR